MSQPFLSAMDQPQPASLERRTRHAILSPASSDFDSRTRHPLFVEWDRVALELERQLETLT
jgi:hypothetical protein